MSDSKRCKRTDDYKKILSMKHDCGSWICVGKVRKEYKDTPINDTFCLCISTRNSELNLSENSNTESSTFNILELDEALNIIILLKYAIKDKDKSTKPTIIKID